MRDFLHTSDGDIDLSSGDIEFSEPLFQHQKDILLTSKGELKHAPDRGVGADNYLNDDSPEAFLRESRSQLTKDGQVVSEIRLTNGVININSSYENS